MVLAALDGLQQLTTVEQIARERGVEPSSHPVSLAREVEGGRLMARTFVWHPSRGPKKAPAFKLPKSGKVRIKQVRSGIGHPEQTPRDPARDGAQAPSGRGDPGDDARRCAVRSIRCVT